MYYIPRANWDMLSVWFEYLAGLALSYPKSEKS